MNAIQAPLSKASTVRVTRKMPDDGRFLPKAGSVRLVAPSPLSQRVSCSRKPVEHRCSHIQEKERHPKPDDDSQWVNPCQRFPNMHNRRNHPENYDWWKTDCQLRVGAMNVNRVKKVTHEVADSKAYKKPLQHNPQTTVTCCPARIPHLLTTSPFLILFRAYYPSHLSIPLLLR